jgi:hypothetical protein
MSIRFACEKCGHPFEVDDRYAGHLGRCKHCGHVAPIPGGSGERPGSASAPVVGLRLRPMEGESAVDGADARPTATAGLQIRPVAPEDLPASRGLDPVDPVADPAPGRLRRWFWPRRSAREQGPYIVLDPDNRDRVQARPFHLSPRYDTRLARFVLRILRLVRDWLYVISIAFLALAAVGFAFQSRPMLHVGATGVIAANIGMLVVSLFYLVTLPFKDSLPRGLGTLLIPPYAVYYWVNHWPQMRKPVLNTLRSFTPIALVGLAYFFYVEAPAIEAGVEKVERIMEKEG